MSQVMEDNNMQLENHLKKTRSYSSELGPGRERVRSEIATSKIFRIGSRFSSIVFNDLKQVDSKEV